MIDVAWVRAACVGHDAEFVSGVTGRQITRHARTLRTEYCNDCPIRTGCLEDALSSSSALTSHGVWAGFTPGQLAKMRSER